MPCRRNCHGKVAGMKNASQRDRKIWSLYLIPVALRYRRVGTRFDDFQDGASEMLARWLYVLANNDENNPVNRS